ncbi:deoxyribose-phosphate aldolase [Trichosporon asahii var. asahii CBS 8904]|uniref:Deoxyribose-phosphate aldolase n=1 Tax=Trichosporon asahii var. asahii (strain CBS 8904) TaxID=1220162 RepID=K1VVT5_TRIAC|nr:deoxyribose-phosphate aldolase [Trichosporon asahii var. asahii CBS 8904]
MEYPLISCPHGERTKHKVIATKRAVGTAGKEVGLVVNIFKAQCSDWRHVNEESHQVNTVVAETGGILKVMADYDNLRTDRGWNYRTLAPTSVSL